MKTNKMISRLFTTLLVLVMAMATTQTFAQDKKAAAPEKKKECKMDKKECKMDKKDCKMKMKECKMDKKECKMDKKECNMDKKECKMDKKAGCCAKKAKTTTTAKGTYVCPMHPEVKSDKPGVCPKCKMALEKK